MSKRRICPFYRFGQCTAVSPDEAFAVVNVERCRKHWFSCNFYKRKIGEKPALRISNKSSNNMQLTEFINGKKSNRCGKVDEEHRESRPSKISLVLRELLSLEK